VRCIKGMALDMSPCMRSTGPTEGLPLLILFSSSFDVRFVTWEAAEHARSQVLGGVFKGSCSSAVRHQPFRLRVPDRSATDNTVPLKILYVRCSSKFGMLRHATLVTRWGVILALAVHFSGFTAPLSKPCHAAHSHKTGCSEM